MGTTGGKEADKQDAIKVYGQWSGTNLDTSKTIEGTTLKVAAVTLTKSAS
jgi:hypothetical protein